MKKVLFIVLGFMFILSVQSCQNSNASEVEKLRAENTALANDTSSIMQSFRNYRTTALAKIDSANLVIGQKNTAITQLNTDKTNLQTQVTSLTQQLANAQALSDQRVLDLCTYVQSAIDVYLVELQKKYIAK